MPKQLPLNLAVLAALFSCLPAHADNPNFTKKTSIDTLDTVVVTATRTERSLHKVPAAVSVVKQKDFSQQQATTVAAVMKKLPNVEFGGGPRFEGQLPTIRGYQGPSITLLVDGARRNSATASALWSPLYLDPYYLKQAEVVRGASSSLYGSGGSGGVMSFTSAGAKDLLVEGNTIGADAKAGYASGDNSQHYNARVYGSNGRADYVVGAGYRKFAGIEQAEGGETLQNAGHSNSALLKLGLEPTDQVRLEISGQTFNSKNTRANNPQIVSAAQTQVNHTQQDNLVLRATTKDKNGAKALDARVYKSRLNVDFDANTTLRLPQTENKTDTLGASLQNTKRLVEGKHALTYGLDTYQDKFTTRSNGLVNPVNPDGKAEVIGGFIQDEIALTDKVNLIPSLRYDRFKTSPASVTNLTPETTFSHTSPKLALSYQATPNVSVYGNYGQAYRAPTVWEMYQNNVNADGSANTSYLFNFKANPNLKPETDTTLELGAKYKRDNVAGGKLQVHATAFKSKAKDLINTATVGTYTRTGVLLPGTKGSVFQYQNVNEADRSGSELEAHYARGAWQVGAGASRIRVKDKTNSNNLFSPPDKVATKVSYTLSAQKTTVAWIATGVAAQDYDTTVSRRRRGYATHDVHVAWKPNRKVEIDVGVNNLFDKKYQSYQSTQATAAYEMGRNYMVSVSGGF